jgi:cytochrome c oxidase cbb3-type subunit III
MQPLGARLPLERVRKALSLRCPRGIPESHRSHRITAPRHLAVAACAALSISLSACETEERRFADTVKAVPADNGVRQSPLKPGEAVADTVPPLPYEETAYAISEGQRLFTWYNCAGCHATNGGGGMGPPLIDGKWIYGSSPENIYATIVEGRPNGMPAFRGKLPEQQVWQLVAYVQSLSGNVPKDAASGRQDNMQVRKQEQALPDLEPEKEAAPNP